MFIFNETYLMYVLLGSNAALLAIACFALFRFERRWRRIETIWNSAADMAMNQGADDEFVERLQASQRLEQRLGELHRSVKVMEMKVPAPAPALERAVPIENAVRMARLGASIEDLTRNCGLNLGEARLLKKLHGKAAIAAVAS